MSPTTLLKYKSCCFLIPALICCQFLKLRSEFTTTSLLCLCMSFIPFSNLPSNLRCNPMDGSYRPTCPKGIYLSIASCMKKVTELKFSGLEQEPE